MHNSYIFDWIVSHLDHYADVRFAKQTAAALLLNYHDVCGPGC
jgi:hypothetical protein